jgi:hypothetical protein
LKTGTRIVSGSRERNSAWRSLPAGWRVGCAEDTIGRIYAAKALAKEGGKRLPRVARKLFAAGQWIERSVLLTA